MLPQVSKLRQWLIAVYQVIKFRQIESYYAADRDVRLIGMQQSCRLQDYVSNTLNVVFDRPASEYHGQELC